MRFTDIYDGPANGTELALGLAVDRPRFALLPFGQRGVFVAGASDRGSSTRRDILLRRYDLKTGAVLATYLYNGPRKGDDRGTVAVSLQGFLGITGEIASNAGTHTNWITLLLTR